MNDSSNGIRALANVRRFPASRRHPQFNQDELRGQLATEGIEYLDLCYSRVGSRGPSIEQCECDDNIENSL